MGLFYEPARATPTKAVEGAIKDALETDPNSVNDTTQEAAKRANEITPPAGYAKFNTGRFVGAIVVFLGLLGAGIGTDAAGLEDSSKAIYGFAAGIFGLVVGFLGGEKPAT
jgi:hypothetical protein